MSCEILEHFSSDLTNILFVSLERIIFSMIRQRNPWQKLCRCVEYHKVSNNSTAKVFMNYL